MKAAWVAVGLLLPGILSAAETPEAVAIPKALQPPGTPEIPDERNAVLLLLKAVSSVNLGEFGDWSKAVGQMRVGRMPEEPGMLEKASAIHQATRGLAGSEGLFPLDDPAGGKGLLVVLRLVQSEEMLARAALVNGRKDEFEQHLATLFAWDKTFRGASPKLSNLALCGLTAATCFDLMLADWATCSEPDRKLDEIEARLRERTFTREAQVAVLGREHEWERTYGAPPKFLTLFPPSTPATFLKPPFDEVEVKELLKLPYDEQAWVASSTEEFSRMVADLRSGKPAREWWLVTRRIPARTLDDYRKMPNGLTLLLSEQMESGSILRVLNSISLMQAQLETAIHWLRAERAGKEFAAGDPGIAIDPMNGKPLQVDVAARFIRSTGVKGKVEGSEEVPGFVGFHRTLECPALRLPTRR
ncbi:hypothetical protein [Luteolibacter sp. LG18]|uniref:hypothetical protein n=1 Tax=Luteolibacter sp. LG18 TaxID=2819286 RepID=UPI002B3135D4|nr:hypothetical protein llg_18440 [Luteolibacter sp. LG18]